LCGYPDEGTTAMTIENPVQPTATGLLQTARDLASSDDESAAPDAYDCAIHAVEQAFRNIATPDNPTDDLGVILSHWQDRPDLWCEGYPRVADIDTVMPVLADLWKGRPEADKGYPVALEEARIALATAEWVLKLFDLDYFELHDELTPEEEAEDLRIAEETLAEYERNGGSFPDAVPWEEVKEELDARWRNE
jgi:hypothetical protein